MATIALVDDHVLLRKSLATLVQSFGHEVIFEAGNGDEFIRKQSESSVPDIVLMDITMPKGKDGFETTRWLKDNYPEIKVLALSMNETEDHIIGMLKNGARGYILKDAEPGDLKAAIDAVDKHGYYYSEMVTGRLIRKLADANEVDAADEAPLLNDREREFLKHICSEMTYKEIADKMSLSPRTIDGYRDALFDKLEIKTRTGLVIYAIREKIVRI